MICLCAVLFSDFCSSFSHFVPGGTRSMMSCSQHLQSLEERSGSDPVLE